MNPILDPTRRHGVSSRRFGLVVVAILALAAVLATAADAQQAATRIAVVNLDYVVANSPAGRALQAKLEGFQREVLGEIENRTKAADDLRQRLVDGANTLSEDRLVELRKEFEDAQTDIKRYQEDKQREGRKMQDDGLKDVEAQLQPVLEQITSEEGFDLILNNVPGVIVMVGARVDITQKVIDRLAAQQAAGGEDQPGG